MTAFAFLFKQTAEHDGKVAVAIVGRISGFSQQESSSIIRKKRQLTGSETQTRQPDTEQADRLVKHHAVENLHTGTVNRLAAVQVIRLDLLPAHSSEIHVTQRQGDHPAGDPVTPCPPTDHLSQLQQKSTDGITIFEVIAQGAAVPH